MSAMNRINVEKVLGRLHAKTDPDPKGAHGCLLWTGAKWHSGLYGVTSNPFCLLSDSKPRRIGVHRLFYILKHIISYPDGELPRIDGDSNTINISHLCHNSLCVNPDHLTLETQAINNERKMCKGSNHCACHTPPCLL